MTQALSSAVERAAELPVDEQDALAAILIAEIASQQRWSRSFEKSQTALEILAAEALGEFKLGQTKPLADA